MYQELQQNVQSLHIRIVVLLYPAQKILKVMDHWDHTCSICIESIVKIILLVSLGKCHVDPPRYIYNHVEFKLKQFFCCLGSETSIFQLLLDVVSENGLDWIITRAPEASLFRKHQLFQLMLLKGVRT